MTINITQGNSAQFFVDFYDPTGNLSNPSGASLTITYTATAGSTASTVLAMTATDNGFTATWASSVAAPGMAQYSANAANQTAPTIGTLRILA